MKQFILFILFLLMLFFALSLPAGASDPKPITLKIKAIDRTSGEVIAKSKRGYLYQANNCVLPDSVKVGSVITAYPQNGKTNCPCLFNRIK